MSRLYNREYLTVYEKIKKKLAGKPLSLLMIDIDYFKQYRLRQAGSLVTDALEMKRNIGTMSVTGSLRSASMWCRGSLKGDTEVSGEYGCRGFWKQRDRMEGNGCARSPVIGPMRTGHETVDARMKETTPMIKRTAPWKTG